MTPAGVRSAVAVRNGFTSLSSVPIPPRVPSNAGSTVSKGTAASCTLKCPRPVPSVPAVGHAVTGSGSSLTRYTASLCTATGV